MLFSVLGISGSIIVFRPEIESALTPHPSQACTAHAPLNEALEAARLFAPNAMIERIAFPPGNASVYVFQLQTATAQRRLSYDACGNRVLGYVPTGWLDRIVDLHHNFLLGHHGRQLVGAAGIGLLLTIASGGCMWFLSGARWRHTFRVTRNASLRRVAFDLHRAIGIAAIIFLTSQAVTGVSLAFPAILRDSITVLTRSDPQPPKGKKGKHGTRRKPIRQPVLADAAALSLATVPGGVIREIRLPAKPAGLLTVRLWKQGDLRLSGENVVTLNREGTRIVSVDLASKQSATRRAANVFTFLHYGEWGGLPARIFMSILGLVPATLFISGLLIRWGPRTRRKSKSSLAPNKRLVAAAETANVNFS